MWAKLPTRRPVVGLYRLEEQFPEWTEIMLSAVCLWADKRFVSSAVYVQGCYSAIITAALSDDDKCYCTF